VPDLTSWESLGISVDDSVFKLSALGQDLLADSPLGYFRMVDMFLLLDGIRCDGRSAFEMNAWMEAGVYEG
jgi:hypothetical protein